MAESIRHDQPAADALTVQPDDDDSQYLDDDELSPDDDEMCIDCQRIGSMLDECCCCGAPMCFACFEMGAGVCKGPHR